MIQCQWCNQIAILCNDACYFITEKHEHQQAKLSRYYPLSRCIYFRKYQNIFSFSIIDILCHSTSTKCDLGKYYIWLPNRLLVEQNNISNIHTYIDVYTRVPRYFCPCEWRNLDNIYGSKYPLTKETDIDAKVFILIMNVSNKIKSIIYALVLISNK